MTRGGSSTGAPPIWQNTLHFCVFFQYNILGFCHKLDLLMCGSSALVCSTILTTHTCYNLYWTVEMLMTSDGPAVIDQIFIKNCNFSTPPAFDARVICKKIEGHNQRCRCCLWKGARCCSFNSTASKR